MIYLDEDGKQLRRSSDDGKTWNAVNLDNDEPLTMLVPHPVNKERAYLVTAGTAHYITEDYGENWRKIDFNIRPIFQANPFTFHSTNADYVLYSGIDCTDTQFLELKCIPKYHYTTNNFKESPTNFVSAHQCLFGPENPDLLSDYSNTVFCSVNSEAAPDDNSASNRRLAYSSDWFKSKSYAKLDQDDIRGIVGVGIASKFLVASAKHKSDNNVSLLVYVDGVWDEAEFLDHRGEDFSEYTITVLESSRHSLHVDILKDGSDISGDFYISNSNGTYFTKSLEHTNRNARGLVDIEKLENIDGVLIANVITNWEEARKGSEKKIRTKISYDDGRTWSYINVDGVNCKGDEECGLNLHSVLDKSNVGRIFSSPALGVISGVGNIGTYLKAYEDGDLYMSHNSGLSWFRSRADAHKYEFGDSGNIITAIRDEGVSNTMIYSTDRGITWNEFSIGGDIRPRFLFTTQDSTSSKFILMGKPSDNKDKFAVYSISFDDLYSRKCELKPEGGGDFEKWYARWKDGSNPSCSMGHTQYFWRRKWVADCFVGDLYNEQIPSTEPCPCTRDDFECDYNFVRQPDGTCKASNAFSEDTGTCSTDQSATYTGKSGYSLIPGNTCTKEGGVSLDEPVLKKCDGTFATPIDDKPPSDDNKQPSNGGAKEVKKVITDFTGRVIDYVYLKAVDPTQADETILLRTSENLVYVTHDHGAVWKKVSSDREIIAIYTNTYFPDRAYLITTKDEVIFTTDRASTWRSFKIPSSRNNMGTPYITFNKANPDWLIWTGEVGCENPFSPDCHTVAYYSQNSGESWNLLQENVRRCTFINDLEHPISDRLIFCETLYASQDGHIKSKLISSTDFFENQKTLYDDIIGFALEHEFIIVATVKEDGESLNAYVSVDGDNFAEVRFPANFQIGKQQAYTILESVTHTIFLHVTTNARSGSEYGAILKSNSNGTDYISSLDFVNRNEEGYVDFEKMIGLEGVAVVNVVQNPKEAFEGSKKKLKTVITHNDGGEWAYLFPPDKDSEGNKYKCPGSSLERCSLNLHGYTERLDYRDTFSSQSAVGMMLAVGNVGDYLTPLHDGNTFFTNDGGITWKEVKKGFYMWEFGDQGSIIVIVNGRDNTNVIYYTLDEGDTWNEYKFSDELMRIEDIATVPSDSSRKFLLIGRAPVNRGEVSVTIQIDFTDLFSRQCVLDDNNPDNDDFELWTPSHPFQENNCLFGHESRYFRKIKGQDCYIGRSLLEPHQILHNCSCNRQDYECDFNYERAADGSCQLVTGYSPPDHSLICAEMPGTIEYWIPTGYRRIPLSTCQGGREFDKVEAKPCPGKEKEFENKHRGLHGFGLFMVIVLPIGMTAVIGYIMWDHFSKRYGQIRLGEEEDDQNIFIHYFIISVAAVIAVVAVIPDVLRSVSGYLQSKFKRSYRFTSRRSFARGRTDYSVVAAAEDELLGADDSSDIGLDDDDDEIEIDNHA